MKEVNANSTQESIDYHYINILIINSMVKVFKLKFHLLKLVTLRSKVKQYKYTNCNCKMVVRFTSDSIYFVR